jgi:hypothetical protein
MMVENDTEELNAGSRRDLIEMLFVEGNHFCMFCEKSGNCELQALAYRFGITAPRVPVPVPRTASGRLAPGRLPRPQPLHPVRAVRAGLAGTRRQERVRLRRAAAHKRLAVNGDGLWRDRPDADRQAVAPARSARSAKRVGYAVPVGSGSTTTSRSGRTSRRGRARAEGGKSEKNHEMPSRRSPRPSPGRLLRLPHVAARHRRAHPRSWSSWWTSTSRRSTTSRQFTGRCAVGLIEGGCCNEENVHVLQDFRKHCDVLISVGDCAIMGGIPAMRNTSRCRSAWKRPT